MANAGEWRGTNPLPFGTARQPARACHGNVVGSVLARGKPTISPLACACLAGAVISEFDARFGSKHPLALTETVAYHLKGDAGTLFSQPSGSLMFAEAVARAEQFDRKRFSSLAKFIGVSPRAMAIRLYELRLVAAYLYA